MVYVPTSVVVTPILFSILFFGFLAKVLQWLCHNTELAVFQSIVCYFVIFGNGFIAVVT